MMVIVIAAEVFDFELDPDGSQRFQLAPLELCATPTTLELGGAAKGSLPLGGLRFAWVDDTLLLTVEDRQVRVEHVLEREDVRAFLKAAVTSAAERAGEGRAEVPEALHKIRD